MEATGRKDVIREMSQAGGQIVPIVWLVAVVGIFYFMLIRPQQQRTKEHERLVKETQVGDAIVTMGGMHGTVKKLDEDTVTVEVAKGISVVFSKNAISTRQAGSGAGASKSKEELGGES